MIGYIHRKKIFIRNSVGIYLFYYHNHSAAIIAFVVICCDQIILFPLPNGEIKAWPFTDLTLNVFMQTKAIKKAVSILSDSVQKEKRAKIRIIRSSCPSEVRSKLFLSIFNYRPSIYNIYIDPTTCTLFLFIH